MTRSCFCFAFVLLAACSGSNAQRESEDGGASGATAGTAADGAAGFAGVAGGGGEVAGGYGGPSGSGVAGTGGLSGAGGVSGSSGEGGAAGTAGASGSSGSGGTSGSSGSAAGNGGSSGSGGASGAGAWRPFNDQSPWNTLIADDPELEPDSAELIADFESSSPYGEHLDVNIAGYSIPLFYVDSSTPTVEVVCDIGGEGFSSSDGFDATASVPMPAGAAPDPESDHHLLIVDRDRGIEWGMWNVTRPNGQWHCGLGATADLTSTGVRPYKPTNPTWYTSHGARACGFPLIAGLIRREEIEAGRIEHALIVAYPHIRAGWYTSPASTAQARVGDDAISTRGIPCGGRIQLDPGLDLDSLDLSRSGRIIAEALQRYGAYVGDYSGAISLYAENSAEAQAYWAGGVLDSYELNGKIDLADFRVLKLGPLTDDGNGG